MRCVAALLLGLVLWVVMGGAAVAARAPRLAYATIDVDRLYGLQPASSAAMPSVTAFPEAGAQTPPALVQASRADGAVWHLSTDAGVTADSNMTNSSDDRFLPFRQGGVTYPIALDPSLRARSGTGRGASAFAGVKLRLSDGAAVAVDAEGQALDYKGKSNDDISFLLAAGPELTWSDDGSASIQLVAAKSWYGGITTNSGLGLRARYSTQVGQGRRVSLYVDTRTFESGYGRAFGGRQAGAYLGASAALDAITSGSIGLFVRREWLRADEYSNIELGAYGGVSRYLGPALTASLSAGLSRTVYDAPLLYLSDERREDWRFNAGVQLTTRESIGMGVYPTIGYSYTKTNGSIDFFDADRHRVRIGIRRDF